MSGIRVIRVISGELSGILLIRSNFPVFFFFLSMVRDLKVNYICVNFSAKCTEFA